MSEQERSDFFKVLVGKCERGICQHPGVCPDAVGTFFERFFITMGHAGYNSPANNRDGYASRARAEAAILSYLKPVKP